MATSVCFALIFLIICVCPPEILGQMSVLNGKDRAAISGDVAEVQGALYDRFFVLEEAIPMGTLPSDSLGFGLTWIGETNAQGELNDWSGVGWTGVVQPSAARWTTTISPSYFLANHNKASPGANGRFFLSNDPSEVPISRVVDTYQQHLRNRLWLGRFETPVDSQQVSYPIYTTEDVNDIIGLEIFIFGRSADYPQFNGQVELRQRVGWNKISEFVLAINDADVDDENSNFLFSFDASIADITGPDGVGDGFVDGTDLLVMATNDYLDNPNFVAGYFDGDLVSVGSSAQRVDELDFDLVLADAGPTGGFGWDEALTQNGDSSGPSFTFIDGRPTLIGTHHRVGQDSYTGFDPAAIVDRIALASGGTERPCFVSFSRKYVQGENAFTRGGTLEDHVGNQRVFGDVTGDYRLNNDDILAMEAEIRAHQDAEGNGTTYPFNWGFDLNDDDEITLADLQTLMIEGFKTSPADFVTEITGASNEAGPDGVANTLGEGFRIVSNLNISNPTYFDGDLNLDGTVNILGDMFILVGDLNQHALFRLNLDFDGTGASAGVLDAADIDTLIAHMVVDPANAPPYDEAFDLTTGTVEPNGTVVLDEQLAGIADGIVNQADLYYYLEEVLGTQFGDINLDGEVNLLGDVSIANNNAQNGTGSGWLGGDVDFDGDVDIDDAILISQLIPNGN